MTPQQNRDDLVKKIVEQRQKDQRREVSGKERAKIEEYVKKEIMPRAYEDNK